MSTLFADGLIKSTTEPLKKKKKKKFRIPNIDVKVIPFINGRWDEGIFQKIMFHTRERKITEAANREVL